MKKALVIGLISVLLLVSGAVGDESGSVEKEIYGYSSMSP